jgi:hypothetical protein
MKRKRKQNDPRQLMLPFPPPPQKKVEIPEWEPPPPISELPPSCKQGLFGWVWGKMKLNPDYFIWPLTDATPGNGGITLTQWPKIGLLRYHGYGVGEKGKPRPSRQAILTRVFELSVLPKLVSPDYILEWGDSRSAKRLKKMAYSIAQFCINNKRRKRAWMKQAIDQYEDDLAWLKKKYYDGHFDQKFIWPTI